MTCGVEEDRLTGRALCAAYPSARTFSAYEIDFTPASAPCSLRVQGAVTIEASGAAASAGASAAIKVGEPYAASDSEWSTPAGVGDPQLAAPKLAAVQDGVDRLANLPVIRGWKVQRGCRATQAVQVPPYGECATLGHLERLEHAVSNHQAVISSGDVACCGSS